MSDVPTWIEAIGTSVAAVGTVTAVSVALWESSRERREKSRLDRREHAARVAAWPAPASGGSTEPGVNIHLSNSSDEPVHEVVVFPVFIQAAAPRSGEEWMRVAFGHGSGIPPSFLAFGALLPGQWEARAPDIDTQLLGSPRLGAEIAFTDRSGVHWIRRATGSLEEIPSSPISYYDIERPIDYANPRVTRLAFRATR